MLHVAGFMSFENSSEVSEAPGDSYSCPAVTDLGHVICLHHVSSLLPAFSGSALCASSSQIPVYQALRAVAWCAAWHAANCSKGFANNARCDEVLLTAACEDAEVAARQLGLTVRTTNSLLEAIQSSAWHCANSQFGNSTDAKEDYATAHKHWTVVRRSAELNENAVNILQQLVWCCCWCTANWRSGCDVARRNLKQERRHAQALGLKKKSAWAPHRTHRMCNREMAWKQRAANDFLYTNSQAAIAERGGLRHRSHCVRHCAKRWIHAMHSKAQAKLRCSCESSDSTAFS